MRSRFTAFLSMCVVLGLTACGGETVTVQVVNDTGEGEAIPVEDNVLVYLPYDRDSIFEELAARAPEPEPRVPEDLQETYEEVQEAQQAWRDAEDTWSSARDRLKSIRERMVGLDRRSREYLDLFREFDDLEGRVNSLDRQKTRLFAQFDSLQKAALQQCDSMQAVITSWEDVAFSDYIDVEEGILEERGVEVREDTTNAEGYATERLPGGAWWVHTRHQPGPFEEIYWNLRIDTLEPDTIRLDSENAEFRPKMC